jgi:hypothetical protein
LPSTVIDRAIPSPTKQDLNGVIHEAFGHIPFVTETYWAYLDWIILINQNDKIPHLLDTIET